MPSDISDRPPFKYDNMFGQHCYAGTVFFAFARGVGMASISSLTIRYRQVHIIREAKPAPEATYNDTYVQGIMSFNGLCNYIGSEILLTGFCKVALPLCLQIWTYSVDRCRRPLNLTFGRAEFSILMNIVVSVPVALDLVSFFRVYPKVLQLCRETPAEERIKKPPWYSRTEDFIRPDHFRFGCTVLLALFWAYVILVTVTIFIMVLFWGKGPLATSVP